MATQKITEKQVVTELKDDAYVYIAQKESVNGTEVMSLRRIEKNNFEEGVGITGLKGLGLYTDQEGYVCQILEEEE